MDITDGELRIRSVRQAIERAQSFVRRYVEQGPDLANELIKERREAGPGPRQVRRAGKSLMEPVTLSLSGSPESERR